MVNSNLDSFIKEAKKQGYGHFPLKKIFLFLELSVGLYPDEYDDFGEFDATALATDLECEFPELQDYANDTYTYAEELAVAFSLTYK